MDKNPQHTYIFITLFLALALGYVLSLSFSPVQYPLLQYTSGDLEASSTPSDWISENQIKVFEDKVELDIKNPQWVTFTPTNSMTPLLDDKSHAIEIMPDNEDQINVGDVVAYERDNGDVILHRVVEIGFDSKGKFFRFQGDNVPYRDPGKIRFSQIRGVVVAVIY